MTAAEQESAGRGIHSLGFNVSELGANPVVADVPAQRTYLLGLYMMGSGGPNEVTIKSNGTVIFGTTPLGPAIILPIAPLGRWWSQSEPGFGFNIDLSNASNVSGIIVYQQF